MPSSVIFPAPCHAATPHRGRLRPLVLLLLLLPPLVSCAPSPSTTRAATVIFASGAELQSIDPLVTVHPLAKQIEKHVLFLTLVSYDSTFHPVPRLARAFAWNADRTMLTFHLRSDVRWHDGVPVRAADVVWTLDAAREAAVAYPRAADLAQVQSITAIDSLTVAVRFARTVPTFPDVLTDLPILPAHRLRNVPWGTLRHAAFEQHPVGDGPFRFVRHLPNQRWIFERDSTFPRDLSRPSFERFVVVVVNEPTTKLAALTSGELDFAGVSPSDAAFVRADKRLRIIDYPIFLDYALVWNLRRPLFQDERVRRALTAAIDRSLIVKAYLYGFGAIADGPVQPAHPWYVPVPHIPHDTTTADSLLDAAGWRRGPDGVRVKDGKRFAFTLLTVGSGDNAMEQMIQAQLRTVGVALQIRQLELSTFLAVAQGAQRDFDALVTGIPGDLALSQVAAMFDGDGPLAYPGYRSAAAHAAFLRVREATTATALAHAWADVQHELARDLPTTWLYHARGVQGASRRIEGVHIDLRGELAGIARWRPIATGEGR